MLEMLLLSRVMLMDLEVLIMCSLCVVEALGGQFEEKVLMGLNDESKGTFYNLLL